MIAHRSLALPAERASKSWFTVLPCWKSMDLGRMLRGRLAKKLNATNLPSSGLPGIGEALCWLMHPYRAMAFCIAEKQPSGLLHSRNISLDQLLLLGRVPKWALLLT